ncbi:hypothetical protein SUDANB130_01120 [Streptomyces sp. enrichment culture]
MKLTKMSHSCVRLEKDGRVLVVDPGGFSEEDAALGADAVLVTHEHPDHFDEGRLRTAMEANPAAEIWTLKAVATRSPPRSRAACTPSATATPSPPPASTSRRTASCTR